MASHSHTINNNTVERLVQNSYDVLGQLTTKLVGGPPLTPGLQKVNYTYNIRGWLTGINDVNNLQQGTDPVDLFAFSIKYTAPGTGNSLVTPLYNGNISRVYWRTASDNIRRTYGYSYDYLNRLLDAFYSIPGTDVNDSYNEHLTYDKNGNITALLRNGEVEDATTLQTIDDLSYDYDDGNKLLNVTDMVGDAPVGFVDNNDHTAPDGEDDFEYDSYGNLIIDRNKSIDEIAYNHLHLPKKITFAGSGTKTIDYLYDANGVKLKKVVTEDTKTKATDYLDGFQYVNETLEFFPHAEGYVKVTTRSNGQQAFNYVYNYTDHLGNIRLRYTEDPSASQDLAILEEDHYYPFGLKHKGYSGSHEIFGMKPGTDDIELIPVTPESGDPYKYKYNGKELQTELGLNLYDYGARNYDATLGRWMNMDPLAEKYIGISPYVYTGNNPILIGDVDGMKWKNEEDKEKGEKIVSDANKTIAQSEKNIEDNKKNIESIKSNDKYSENAKERKIKRQEKQMQKENETITNSKLAIQAIDKIGSEDNPIEFTFNEISGDTGYLTLGESDEIIINYVGEGNDVHEAFHAAQYSVGGMKKPTIVGQKLEHLPNRGLSNEIKAYQVQYSIYPNSIPESSKTVVKPSDIDKKYIKGLKDNPYGL